MTSGNVHAALLVAARCLPLIGLPAAAELSPRERPFRGLDEAG